MFFLQLPFLGLWRGWIGSAIQRGAGSADSRDARQRVLPTSRATVVRAGVSRCMVARTRVRRRRAGKPGRTACPHRRSRKNTGNHGPACRSPMSAAAPRRTVPFGHLPWRWSDRRLQRARTFYTNLKSDKLELIESDGGRGLPGSEQSLSRDPSSSGHQQTAVTAGQSSGESPATL